MSLSFRGSADKPERDVGHNTLAASIRVLLGGASTKLLGTIMGMSAAEPEEEEPDEELWFTSMDDFKPVCHMLHRGKFMTAYFACANRTGQHFVLKKYDKREL